MVRINWSPSPKDLRIFGVTMAVGFGLIGALFHARGHASAAYGAWIFGAVAATLGLTGTQLALPIYWAWMGVAFVMGHIMTRVVLILVYYGVVTPVGVISRLAGRDVLALTPRNPETYWKDLKEPPEDPAAYERQF